VNRKIRKARQSGDAAQLEWATWHHERRRELGLPTGEQVTTCSQSRLNGRWAATSAWGAAHAGTATAAIDHARLCITAHLRWWWERSRL